MSTLRSGLEELETTELRFVSDQELEGILGEIDRAMGVLEVVRSRAVAEVERRGSFANDGHLSVTSWVEHRFRTGWAEASQQVRMARGLEQMPATREALLEGEVSRAAVGQLVAAHEANPEEFSGAEETLVEAARSLSVRDLKKAVSHWRDLVDQEGAERDAEERLGRRQLHVSPTFGGMVRVDGDLDPETGQSLITALRAVTDSWVRSGDCDNRTPAQRRADALGEVCRQWLDASGRPQVAGERPHVMVTVDLEALEGRAGHRCDLDDTGRITPEATRRLACDAQVVRVITRGRSEPLDVGRKTAVVPPSLRGALVIRDEGCRFPGCDRPPPWCDAHHVVHWADGGETKLGNLALLCRPHHRVVHEGGFGIEMVDGTPVFRRPDGTLLEGLGPP